MDTRVCSPLCAATSHPDRFGSGGDRGSGSNWLCDGGALVRKSVALGKPIIVVTFKWVEVGISYRSCAAKFSFDISFRLGLLGSAASPMLAEINQAAGDVGVGNYGTFSF
jgi:hypothetical protein